MNMFLLQDQVKYFKDDDPRAAIFLGIGFGVAVLVITLISFIRRARGPEIERRGGRRLSGFALRRAARPFGLNRGQIKVLEYVFRLNGVTDPFYILDLPSVLDKCFKRAFQQIEDTVSSEEDAQRRLALLFSVRNTIDVAQNTTTQAIAAQPLSTDQQVTLTVNQESYTVKVISVKGDTVSVEHPKNARGNTARFSKGTKVNLAFYTKNKKGFSFGTQIIGSAETSFGPALQLTREGRIPRAMIQRRFSRKKVSLSCTFSLVRIESVPRGRKKKPKMIVEAKRNAGTIVDVSVGGCAIRSGASIQAGTRLKIEFEYYRSPKPAALLGQILRINREGRDNVLYVRFLKVPRAAMNAINTIVFEYSGN